MSAWNSHDDSLFSAVLAVAPNASPWWSGQMNYEGAEIHVDGRGAIVITPDDELGVPGNYLFGLYEGDGWETGAAALEVTVATSKAHAVEIVRHLLNDQPEGVDWASWAAQRMADGIEL